MLILQKKLRSRRHLLYLWIVLGKSALHVTRPDVSPSLMFSMVQWGLCHMAKLVLHKVALCTPDLAMIFFKVWVKSSCACAKINVQMVQETFVAHQLLKISYLQKISQLSSRDGDRWQSLGHIVTFAHHVSYRARYLWFISFGAFFQCW